MLEFLQFFSVQVLSYSSGVSLQSHDQALPSGCAAMPITSDCEAYLSLKGVIDVQKETERLLAKKAKIEPSLVKLRTAAAASDYLKKVPEATQTANAEKLLQLQGELDKVQQAIAAIALVDA